MQKRLLIIDGLNNFYRAWIKSSAVTSNGTPVGGTKTFLFILQKLCEKINPSAIFIIWDGEGGSTRRRQVDHNYKSGRKPLRLNRQYQLSEQEELNNRVWQQVRLIEYLNYLPVVQILENGVEADDVIAYITQLHEHKGHQKVIVSSDKDFFQLCDEETIIYRPIKEEFVNTNKIVNEYNIHPANFSLARSIIGDKSDNISGIKGSGLKTVGKRFPFLKESKSYTITDIINYSRAQDSDKIKLYQDILNNEELIEKNYKITQLYVPTMSVQSKLNIKHILANYDKSFSKFIVQKMMMEDGFANYDWSSLFLYCNKLCG